MPLQIVVDEIRRLSQEEGLNDLEIAKILGYSRVSVCGTRKMHNIGRANLANRRDKTFVCGQCQKTVTIRRKERRRLLCEDCQKSSE